MKRTYADIFYTYERAMKQLIREEKKEQLVNELNDKQLPVLKLRAQEEEEIKNTPYSHHTLKEDELIEETSESIQKKIDAAVAEKEKISAQYQRVADVLKTKNDELTKLRKQKAQAKEREKSSLERRNKVFNP